MTVRTVRALGCLLGLALPISPAVSAQESDQGDAQQVFDAIQARFEAAKQKARDERAEILRSEAYKEARQSRDYDRINALLATAAVDADRYAEEFLEASKPFAGTEHEVRFLEAAYLSGAQGEVVVTAAEGLIARHPDSEGARTMAKTAYPLLRGPGRDAFPRLFDALVRATTDDEIEAWALYAKVTYQRSLPDEVRDELRARIFALVPDDHLIALRARGPEFEKTRLQIGMEAPDIEGVDLDGKPFKLSDYRGKVVVLDFWGDW